MKQTTFMTSQCETSDKNKLLNRPFPSSKKFHFENEAKCETFVVGMSFNYDANKTHFHNKGFALSLVLKVKLFGTRKWPICLAQIKNPPEHNNEPDRKNINWTKLHFHVGQK